MEFYFRTQRSDAYAQNKGFALKAYLLDCIRRGQRSNIKAVLATSLFAHEIEGIFGNDLELANMSFAFMWAQAQRAAVEGGLTEEAASHIYNKYFLQARRNTSIREYVELNEQLFLEFAESVAAAQEDVRFSPLVRRCCIYIAEHINDPLTVSQISEAMNFSKSYISHIFKRETGETLLDFVHKQKIAEARRLIESSPFTLTEIGQKLGFCSQSHFTSVFRKITGSTPSQYHRTYRLEKALQNQDHTD